MKWNTRTKDTQRLSIQRHRIKRDYIINIEVNLMMRNKKKTQTQREREYIHCMEYRQKMTQPTLFVKPYTVHHIHRCQHCHCYAFCSTCTQKLLHHFGDIFNVETLNINFTSHSHVIQTTQIVASIPPV